MMRNVCCLVCLVAIVACVRTSLAVVIVPNRTEDVADSGLVPQSAERLFGHADRQGDGVAQGRTFGHKRIQFMFMPMIYKMGVMMTMLAVLTAISLKSLMIGVVLLVLKLSTIFAKFYSAWQPQGYAHGHEWSSPHQQPVHVHVHGEQFHQQAYAGQMPYDDKHYYYK